MSAVRIEMQIEQSGDEWGRIVLELDEEAAPETVKNFLAYVDDGFFDGTIFHRVIPNFMIQGGGYTSVNEYKSEGLRPPIRNEAANGLKNERGTIAMARTSDPHSATSQFFINVADNAMLDHPGHDNWGYAVFGRVVEGMDVVDRIKDVETQPNPQMGENSQPVNPPRIKKAARVS
ncbi:MAG: peptidyl-prolyl cis-trans isomerase [Planctomycetota bacterium]|nr:MAG: peptidyl-prolyl cis-trans isomerase [Planctomycetota bacterium]